jgi:hypothetical protein
LENIHLQDLGGNQKITLRETWVRKVFGSRSCNGNLTSTVPYIVSLSVLYLTKNESSKLNRQ